MSIADKINDAIKSIKTKEDVNELAKILVSDETQKIIQIIKDPDLSDEKFADYIYDAIAIINASRYVTEYTSLYSGLSNTDYDVINERLNDLGLNDEFTVPVALNKNKSVVYHTYKSLRGTLDKVYMLTDEEHSANKSRKSLDDWIRTSERKIKEKTGRIISLKDVEIYCFPKWDGLSGEFEIVNYVDVDRALSRGFTATNEAEDYTAKFKDWYHPADIGIERLGRKTEIIMTDDDYVKCCEMSNTTYVDNRAAVSSIMNSSEIDGREKLLKMKQLRISVLNEDGTEGEQELAPEVFDDPYLRCKMSDRELMKQFALDHRNINGFNCDGMVIYIIDKEIQRILGRENDKQKFEVAYKFTEESTYTKVKDIIFTTGLFGRISPVVILEPVMIKSKTVKQSSLGSIPLMNLRRLAKGDTVKLLYDIIPYVTYIEGDPNCKRSGNLPIQPPEFCPDCGETLEATEGILYCRNMECPCRIKGKILNYIFKLDIKGISYAVVDDFYKAGFLKTIKDLYFLYEHKEEIINMEGYGITSYNNMIEEINNHKDLTESEFLGSIGIESIAIKTFDKLLKTVTFEDLIHESESEDPESFISLISSIKGFGEKKAIKIYEGLRENRDFIKLALELLNIRKNDNTPKRFSVCFTKVPHNNILKPKISDLVVELGGVVVDKADSETNVVITPERGITSGNVKTALKHSIPIIPIDEAEAYLKDNFRKRF